MNNLRISSAELRDKATLISTKASEMKTTEEKMFSIAETINGAVWSGDTQSMYVSRFEELRESIPVVHTRIDEIVADMNQIATEYEKAEEITAEYVQSLTTAFY